MARSKISAEFRTLDAETDPFKHGRIPQPFLWGLYSGAREEYEEFTSIERLVARLEGLGGTVYAHNGGRFDYHFLRDYINSDEPVLLINGRLAKFRIGNTEFRDSLNLFPNTRLKDFNDASGKKLEIDYAKMEPGARDEPNNRAEISLYLRQDCVRLYNVIERYRDKYGRSLTQATSSMRNFERMYDIKAPRQTQVQYNRYKPFYYGGRVQCFEQGCSTTQFQVADINSAYPYAMLSEHPFAPAASLEAHLPPEPEIYQCFIELDCSSRGAFPWRDANGELYFPEDDGKLRRYFVTGWEFLTALELDAVTNIHIRAVHRFNQTMNFRQYIEHHYGERMAAANVGDVAGKIFGKYFMNSLYGKFGANCEKYQEYVIATEDSLLEWTSKGYREFKPWGDRFLLCRSPTTEELNDLTSYKWRYYNVATAASVTGFVRAFLFRALSASSGLIYCDTDSIAARNLSDLAYGDALGQWKREGTFDRYSIAGKKLYAFHYDGRALAYDPKDEKTPTWKIASKGVNFGALASGPELIERIALGEAVDFNPEVPTFSATRAEPRFISRRVIKTAKNIALAPELDL